MTYALSTDPPRSAITVSHAVYALHAFAVVTGIVGAASIAGSFVGSVPSILGVILNYAFRRNAGDTWAETHYTWQIRTFWGAFVWFLIAWGLILTLIGSVLGIPLLVILTVWLVYRIARGWMRLREHAPMYM